MIQHYEKRRRCFLLQALDDARKWSVAPERLVIPDRKRSDQFWLWRFSSASESVTADDAHYFLVSWQLTNHVKWNKEAVADRIMNFRREDVSDVPAAISTLANDLRGYITSKKRGLQTSAASKIAFFTAPLKEVYIWDQYASRSARFRDWRRDGGVAKRPRFDRLFGSVRGEHDYSAYAASCAKALDEERLRDDFAQVVKEFRDYLQRVGGPMADPKIMGSSFIERRFLDKLMFWEGRWVKDLSSSTELHSEKNDKSKENKFKRRSERREALVSETRIGRKVERGSGSAIDVIIACLESGLSSDQVVEKCMPLYLRSHPDRASQPGFKKWVAQRVKAQINWAKKNVLS